MKLHGPFRFEDVAAGERFVFYPVIRGFKRPEISIKIDGEYRMRSGGYIKVHDPGTLVLIVSGNKP